MEKTITYLNEKMWYRFLKVMFIFVFILSIIFVIGSLVAVVGDRNNDLIVCNYGNKKTFLRKNTDIGYWITEDSIKAEFPYSATYWPSAALEYDRSLCQFVNAEIKLPNNSTPPITIVSAFSTFGAVLKFSLYLLLFSIIDIFIFVTIKGVFYYIALGKLYPKH